MCYRALRTGAAQALRVKRPATSVTIAPIEIRPAWGGIGLEGERRAGMSDTVFISYHPADAARAGTIASALRGEGVLVAGDLAIPAGMSRVEMFGEALRDAWVVVALWSPTSSGDAALADEAASAVGRGAYLGATLDGARPPAAFADAKTVDLTGWSGARDRKLAELVDAVKERLRPAAAPPPPVFTDNRRGRRGGGVSKGALVAVVIAIVVGVAALAVVLTRRDATDHAAEIRTRLAAIPCAWLKVDPVDNGSNGKLALTGVADDPARAGEVIRGLVRGDAEPAEVTTDRIARIGSNDCPAIDVPRTLRRDDGGRMRVTSDGIGVDKAMKLAEARLRLAFRSGDKAMSLFGMEPNGNVTWILPDFQTLNAIGTEDIGFVKQDRTYEFSLRSDHTGWTGLLLVTGDKPLPAMMPQMTVQNSAQFAAYLRDATKAGRYEAEMVWYEIQQR